MTTKYRIIVGFTVMMLLACIIAWLGYSNLQDASDGFQTASTDFEEFQRLSLLNIATSDVDSNLNRFAYRMYHFIDSNNADSVNRAKQRLQAVHGIIKEGLTHVVKPERRDILNRLDSDTATLENNIDALKATSDNNVKKYAEVTEPLTRAMAANFREMTAMARDAGNANALYDIADSLNYYGDVTTDLALVNRKLDPKDVEHGRQTLASMTESMKSLGAVLQTDEGKRLFQTMSMNFEKIKTAFQGLEKDAADIRAIKERCDKLLVSMLASSNDLSVDVNKQMSTYGQAVLKNNSDGQVKIGDAQSFVLMVSAAALLLGVLLAAFITWRIIHVLGEVSSFATAVSEGDFAYSLRTREGGEIGGMIMAIRKIPAVLETVLKHADNLANSVVSGKFRERLRDDSLHGSFSDLAKAVNVVSDAYTEVLDSMPQPLMTCDKDHMINFLNPAAQRTIGGDLTDTKCSDHLKAGECNTNDCFGKIAMREDAVNSGETIVHPQGKEMNINVVAMPMHNLRRDVVGYIEIMTDLTAIRTKEKTMLQVAQEATVISDQVAAASERLSSQVAQVSKGAEMQRDRVESTASAMTEMNATVLEVARSAGQAADQSNETREKADIGAGLVNSVVKSMDVVNTVAVNLQGNMQDLGKQAENIGGVMNVISDIADQTNLLALNAAIEAARAGEAGRGFAVVADEVRKLAEKTMSATNEVGASINSIQQSAHTNIAEVESAVKHITEATGLANDSGVALKEIVDLAAANSSVVASIATAAEEQSATSEEINRAIDQINVVVGETTEGMIQSSSAVQDLSRMAQDLKKVMEGLK